MIVITEFNEKKSQILLFKKLLVHVVNAITSTTKRAVRYIFENKSY